MQAYSTLCPSLNLNRFEVYSLTLIRSVLYRLVHFFLELFLNTDALSKKKLK